MKNLTVLALLAGANAVNLRKDKQADKEAATPAEVKDAQKQHAMSKEQKKEMGDLVQKANKYVQALREKTAVAKMVQ